MRSARRPGRGSSVDPHTAAVVPRGSTVGCFLQPSLSAFSAVQLAASSHQQAFFFSLSRNATGVDQDDAVGPDAFDYRLLEKRTFLEAAACFRRTPSRCSHPCGPSFPALGSIAPSAQAVEPSSCLLSLPLSCAQLCQKAATRCACRRTPLLRSTS